MKKFYILLINFKNLNNGGETGIRTQERVAPLPVFKTGAFNRSAISPCTNTYSIIGRDSLSNTSSLNN